MYLIRVLHYGTAGQIHPSELMATGLLGSIPSTTVVHLRTVRHMRPKTCGRTDPRRLERVNITFCHRRSCHLCFLTTCNQKLAGLIFCGVLNLQAHSSIILLRYILFLLLSILPGRLTSFRHLVIVLKPIDTICCLFTTTFSLVLSPKFFIMFFIDPLRSSVSQHLLTTQGPRLAAIKPCESNTCPYWSLYRLYWS